MLAHHSTIGKIFEFLAFWWFKFSFSSPALWLCKIMRRLPLEIEGDQLVQIIFFPDLALPYFEQNLLANGFFISSRFYISSSFISFSLETRYEFFCKRFCTIDQKVFHFTSGILKYSSNPLGLGCILRYMISNHLL